MAMKGQPWAVAVTAATPADLEIRGSTSAVPARRIT